MFKRCFSLTLVNQLALIAMLYRWRGGDGGFRLAGSGRAAGSAHAINKGPIAYAKLADYWQLSAGCQRSKAAG